MVGAGEARRGVLNVSTGILVVSGIVLLIAAMNVANMLLARAVQRRTGTRFPWGIFVVNVTGSWLLGLLTGAVLHHAFPETPAIVLGTGLCGAYTTFSTFSVDTVRLIEEGAFRDVARNVVGSVVVGMVAAAAGLATAAAF
jgi:CrcB protein